MRYKNVMYCVVVVMIAIVVLVGTGCSEHAHNAEEDHEEHTDTHDDEGRFVEIDKETQEIIGLKTDPAGMKAIEKRILVYGEVAQDADTYTNIVSEEQGTVESVDVSSGKIVDHGEPIMTILNDKGEKKTITALDHGTVIAVHVKPGERVDLLKALASLAYLDTLRVSFDIYEKDLRFVREGQRIEVESAAFPDKKFQGEVVFISPRIDRNSQTIKIRAEVENTEHLLRLGMFVTGELIIESDERVLAVPQAAVQQLKGEYIVFVVHDEEFLVKEVLPGQEFGEYVEIKKGLKENDLVVTKGSFALKSELEKGAFGDGHAH